MSLSNIDKKIILLESFDKNNYDFNVNDLKIHTGIKSCLTPKQFTNKPEISKILESDNLTWFEIPETGICKATIDQNLKGDSLSWDIVSAIIHFNNRKPKSIAKNEGWIILDNNTFAIMLLSDGKLRFYNYFEDATHENILYFFNACCKNFGFDFASLKIYITGDKPESELIENLTTYCGKPDLEFAEFAIGLYKFQGWSYWLNHILTCV